MPSGKQERHIANVRSSPARGVATMTAPKKKLEIFWGGFLWTGLIGMNFRIIEMFFVEYFVRMCGSAR